MEDTILSFLDTYKIKFLTLHALGMAMGLGGATISDILFFKFLKDNRISKKEHSVLNILKTIIFIALGLIIFSGLAMYLPHAAMYQQSAPFLVKMVGVGVVTLNGIALHTLVAPHLLHLDFKNQQKMGRRWHKLAFALGAISAASWYSVFLIAMLKSVLPNSFYLLISIYLGLLLTAIGVSQLFERYFYQRARQ